MKLYEFGILALLILIGSSIGIGYVHHRDARLKELASKGKCLRANLYTEIRCDNLHPPMCLQAGDRLYKACVLEITKDKVR